MSSRPPVMAGSCPLGIWLAGAVLGTGGNEEICVVGSRPPGSTQFPITSLKDPAGGAVDRNQTQLKQVTQSTKAIEPRLPASVNSNLVNEAS